MINIESVPPNISYKSFKTSNLLLQNSETDHRNFDTVNQPYCMRTNLVFNKLPSHFLGKINRFGYRILCNILDMMYVMD